MSRHSPPGSLGPLGSNSCDQWEAALADLLDGTLIAGQEAEFRRHAADCPACGALLKEATEGQEWARLLHESPPAVPDALLGRILAATGPLHSSSAGVAGVGHFEVAGDTMAMPLATLAWSLRREQRARMVMTAAVAFFSIAITLSMIGFRMQDVRAAAHAPAAMQAAASRRFYEAKKQVISFYDNLRVVREFESSMEDMRGSADAGGGRQPKRPQPSARRGAEPFAPALVSGAAATVSHSASVFLETNFVNRNTDQADERNTL